MTPDTQTKGADYYQRLITVILMALAVIFVLSITMYWSVFLQPRLATRAKVTARSVLTSHLVSFIQVLDNDRETALYAAEIYLGKILILRDRESRVPFISYLELHVEGETGDQTHIVGRKTNEDEKMEDIPLFSDKTRELLGVVTWNVNPMYVGQFVRPIKVTFFAGVGVGIVLFALAWWGTILMFARVREAEKVIEENKAQIIHAGRLTALGEMATGIAHELNQPLAIIRIASDGLNDWFSKSQQNGGMEKKAAETITHQVERARTIIDHMRAFSRSDTMDKRQVRLAEPITNAVSFFREQFKHHDIDLTMVLEHDDLCVTMNPDKFEQIVVNLLSNARFAVDSKEKDSKCITIRLFRDKDNHRIVFEVSDNGIGMDIQERERCLEPFYTTKPVGDGTGLGLSIVHTIAKESGMGLEIESEKEKGSTFRLIIPEN